MASALCPSLHAALALLPQGWCRDVRLTIAADGRIAAVTPGVAPQPGEERAAGPVVPAMPNLHSHSFQRAMAGLAETATTLATEDFWSWRGRMYHVANAVTPDDVETIATSLYIDLLKGGYGAVAEFHYLHHDPAGRRYADPAELSRRIVAAAAASGIGLTLLPVFYAHGDFGGAPAQAGQRRFLHGVDDFLALLTALAPAAATPGTALGLAIHSLRAATPAEIAAIVAAAGPQAAALHIHIAEQQKEVADCLAWSGRRPVAWLLDEVPVDSRWCLVHATHLDDGELARLAASGAVAGLCPTTEANLGDGLFPAVAYRAAGGVLGIGSDSHVSVGVAEELRWLDYGQRLRDRQRLRLADGPGRSTGRSLFDAALTGGARALGQPLGALAAGALASLVVLDGDDPLIACADGDAILDRWLFASGDRVVRDVMVAGRWQVRQGRHPLQAQADQALARLLRRLAATA